MNRRFSKNHHSFISMANILLEQPDHIKDLYSLPMISNQDNPFNILLAILIQNCFQAKNSQRTRAVQTGKYIEMLSTDVANDFLKNIVM